MASITEITLVGGDRLRIDAGVQEVEQLILDAARGSLLQLAWLSDLETGELLGINPAHVMLLRAVGSSGQDAPRA